MTGTGKRHLSLFCIVALSATLSCGALRAAEIATVMGNPDFTLDFVSQLVTENTSLVKAKPEVEVSTMVYSILARRGIKHAANVVVLNEDGSADSATLARGLEAAADRAPVVLTNLGPIENEMCALLSRMGRVAFVIVSGNSGQKLDPVALPECEARNILRVAALNQNEGELLSFANFGSLVRIAAPGRLIRVIGPGDKLSRITSTSASAALVAARLAVFAHAHAELRGGELVEDFLHGNTVHLPKLEGFVADGLALDDTGF